MRGTTRRPSIPLSSDASRRRHARQLRVAVAVAAGLQPAVELAVVQQQDALKVFVDHQARRRQMADEAGAPVGVGGVLVNEVEDAPMEVSLLVVTAGR